jgi:uncharacterized membrane protein YphA (DoxX/SURF4 family)
MAGVLTRVFTILFVIEMIVAILSTKISLFNGTSPLALPPSPPKVGFWAVMHETRSDYAQLLTSAFLMIAGPGKWSIDAVLARRRRAVTQGAASSSTTSWPKITSSTQEG